MESFQIPKNPLIGRETTMKQKIIGIFICMLLLCFIPHAAGTTITQEPEQSRIGWTTIQGIIFGLREINGGALLVFRCIFVHYVGQGLGQRVTGFRYGGQLMAIPNTFKGILMPRVIMGWCWGVLEF